MTPPVSKIPEFPSLPYEPLQVAVDADGVTQWCQDLGSDLHAQIAHFAICLRKRYPRAHVAWAWDSPEQDIERINPILSVLGISSWGRGDSGVEDVIVSCGIMPPAGLLISSNPVVHSLVEDGLSAISLSERGWQAHTVSTLRQEWGIDPRYIIDVLSVLGEKGLAGATKDDAIKLIRDLGCSLSEAASADLEAAGLKPFVENYYTLAPTDSLNLYWVPMEPKWDQLSNALVNAGLEEAIL
jgi:hypothetical protein